MAITFDGQVAIVTGAGQGLGREYALDLGRRGARVVVNDLAGLDLPEGSAAEAVVREIEAAGGVAVASHDSVATPEGGKAIVDCALQAFGTVDAVIHNAGVWRHKLYEDMTVDQLDRCSTSTCAARSSSPQPAWPVMQAKGYGRIVLTSSSTGAFGRELVPTTPRPRRRCSGCAGRCRSRARSTASAPMRSCQFRPRSVAQCRRQ